MLLNADLADDGGVRDLALLLDLEDHSLRRQRGDAEYFDHLKKDCLPRNKVLGLLTNIHALLPANMPRPTSQLMNVPVKTLSRKQQKSKLAEVLYVDSPFDEDRSASEIFSLPPLPVPEKQLNDFQISQRLYRRDKLKSLVEAVHLSLALQDLGCISLSLSELAKRRLLYDKFPGGPAAAAIAGVRACNLALAVVGTGTWDSDLVALEACSNLNFERDEESAHLESRTHNPDNERPSLSSDALKAYSNNRVSVLCRRAALLQKGNCLTVLGKFSDARKCYEEMHAYLMNESRCPRIDWELFSCRVNMGKTHMYAGEHDLALAMYDQALAVGEDHREGKHPGSAKFIGMQMRMQANTLRIAIFKLKGDKASMEVATRSNVEDGGAVQKQLALQNEMQERQRFAIRQAQQKAEMERQMSAKALMDAKGNFKTGGPRVLMPAPPAPGSPKKAPSSAAADLPPQSPKRESEGGDWVDVEK